MDQAATNRYPGTINPDGSGDANEGRGLPTGGTAYEYSVDNTAGTYCLSGVSGNKAYYIVSGGSILEGVCPGHSGPGENSGEGGSAAIACASLSVGDAGPGGGIIFHKDTTTVPGTCYEAAPADWHPGESMFDGFGVWGCYEPERRIRADGEAIGTGRQNTAIILAANCSSTYPEIPVAAVVAANYRGGGMTDWFLPSEEELHELLRQQDVIGGIDPESSYWSSTEYNLTSLINGVVYWDALTVRANKYWTSYITSKSSPRQVHPVRSFTD